MRFTQVIGIFIAVFFGLVSLDASAASYKYQYYEGDYSSFPDFSAEVPIKDGYLEEISLEPRGVTENYGFRYVTNITLEAGVDYQFLIGVKGQALIKFGNYNGSGYLFSGDDVSNLQNLFGGWYDGFITGPIEITVDFVDHPGEGDIQVLYSKNRNEEMFSLSEIGDYEPEFSGVRYQFFDYEDGTSLPDLDTLVSTSNGELSTVEIPQDVTDDSFAVRFEGYLDISEPGDYTIRQNFIGTLTTNNWGDYLFAGGTSESSTLTFSLGPKFFEYGKHAFILDYHNISSSPLLSINIKTPSGVTVPLSEMLVKGSVGEPTPTPTPTPTPIPTITPTPIPGIALVANISATVNSNGVNVFWTPVSADAGISTYRIQRGIPDDTTYDLSVVDTLSFDTTSYTDNSANSGATYGYWAQSVTDDNEISDINNSPFIIVNVPSAFDNISSLNASESTTSVDLTWSASNVVGDSKFIVERSVNSSDFESIATLAASVSSYSDNSAPQSSEVTYRLSNVEEITDSQSGQTYAIVSDAVTVSLTTADPLPESGVVDYQYFAGDFTPFPDFSSVTPTRSGKMNDIDLSPAPDLTSSEFAITYSGTLHIPETGDYRFFITSKNMAFYMSINGGSTVLFNFSGDEQGPGAIRRLNFNGLPAGEYTFTATSIAEYANPALSFTFDFNGGVAQPIVNLLGVDSDNDGVIDGQDAYPNDPDRTALEIPQSLNAVSEGQTMTLNWAALDLSDSHVANIRIFRRIHGTQSYTLIDTVAATQSTYNDTNGSNGVAYDYTLRSVTTEGILSEASVGASAFLAYNDIAITSFTAVQESVSANLAWTSAHTGEYRVQRGLLGGALAPIQTTTDTTWTDTSVQIGSAYDYAVQTVLTFDNPLTSTLVEVFGPLSSRQSITMPNALVMQLTNFTEVSDGQYQLLLGPNSTDTIVVQGEFEDALGEVTVSAQSGSDIINAQVSGSSFTLNLPRPAGPITWQINGRVDTGSAQQAEALSFNFTWDETPPVITIDGTSPRSTNDDLLTITGTVSDLNDVSTVDVTSDRYGEQTFSVFVDEAGAFSADVPIEFDENFIKVSALDSVGNTDYAVLVVNRANVNRPEITMTSHVNGQVVKDSTITLIGELTSAVTLTDITLILDDQINDAQTITLQEESSGHYRFVIHDLQLQEGSNLLAFEATAGTETSTLSFYLNYDSELLLTEPVLSDIRPLSGSYVNSESFMFAGKVTADYAITDITVNGQSMTLFDDSVSANFSTSIDFSGASTIDVLVTARAINGLTVSETYTYHFDDQPPVISAVLTTIYGGENGHLGGITINSVFDNPYQFGGLVEDMNFSSLTINDQVVDIYPGNEENEFIFQAILNLETLASGEYTSVYVTAYDQAGNSATETYLLQPRRQTETEIIAPRIGSEFIVDDTHYDLQILARATNLPDNPRVFARVLNLSEITTEEALNPKTTIYWNKVTFLTLHDNGVITGEITIPADTANYVLQVFIYNTEVPFEEGGDLSFTNREFAIDNKYTAPLELLRNEPTNLATGIEPNEPIVLYFNKGFNADKMTLTVTETAHGNTYIDSDALGTNFLEAKGNQLQEVHRQKMVVPGGLSQFPGDNIFAFYPERDFAYGGLVQVEVAYRGVDVNGNDEGEKVDQFQFNIRPLPTMIEGMVVDQLGQMVSDVKVSIPELDRETYTDAEGAFSFGYGDTADNTMKGGLYSLVVNANLTDTRFGELSRQVNVGDGQLNSTGILRLPVLNTQTPFYAIESGQSQAVLGAGELILDLSNTKLTFANGKESGQVHVNFMQMSNINLGVFGNLLPNWMFALQPQGITTSGATGVAIKAPTIDNSLGYLPEDNSLVLLMGQHASQPQLIPLGAGYVDNGWIKSYRPVEYPLLDYIGFTIVPQIYQAVLQRFADGEIGMAQLISDMQTTSEDILQEVQ